MGILRQNNFPRTSGLVICQMRHWADFESKISFKGLGYAILFSYLMKYIIRSVTDRTMTVNNLCSRYLIPFSWVCLAATYAISKSMKFILPHMNRLTNRPIYIPNVQPFRIIVPYYRQQVCVCFLVLGFFLFGFVGVFFWCVLLCSRERNFAMKGVRLAGLILRSDTTWKLLGIWFTSVELNIMVSTAICFEEGNRGRNKCSNSGLQIFK